MRSWIRCRWWRSRVRCETDDRDGCVSRDANREITRQITKHNYLVMNVEEIPRIVREAFFLAASGRPGPVLIDIRRMCNSNWRCRTGSQRFRSTVT